MATRRRSIMQNVMPDASGKAWIEPLSILGTSDQWRQAVMRIDEAGANNAALTTKAGFYGSCEVPDDYLSNSNANIIIVWTATVTTGNVVWDFDYRAITGNDAESIDQAGTQEAVTGTDAGPSAAWERLELAIPLTEANLVANDTLEFYVSSDGTDAADTLAGARILLDVLLEYVDT